MRRSDWPGGVTCLPWARWVTSSPPERRDPRAGEMCRSLSGQLGCRDQKKREILNRQNQETLVGPACLPAPLGPARCGGDSDLRWAWPISRNDRSILPGGASQKWKRTIGKEPERFSFNCQETGHVGRSTLNALSDSYTLSHLRQGTSVLVLQAPKGLGGFPRTL